MACVAVAAGIALGAFEIPSGAAMVMVAIVGAGAMAVIVWTREGIDRLLMLLLGVGALLTPMNGLRVGPLMSLGDTFLLSAVPLVIGRRIFRIKKTTRQFRPFYSALLLILLGGLVASSFSDGNPVAAMPDLARFAISTFGVLSLVAAWGPDRSQVRLLMWLFAVGTSINVILGVVTGFTFVGRAVGLSTHPNHLGMVCMLASGIALGLALTSHGVLRKSAVSLFLIVLAGVMVSGSRAALVGEIFFVLTLLLALRRWYVMRWVGVLAMMVIVAGIAGAVPIPSANSFQRLLGDESASLSDAERDDARTASLDQINQDPVTGSGFEFSRVAHSLYLQVWVSCGLIGLAGLLLLILLVGRLLVYRSPSDVLIAGAAASFVGFLVAGMASNILWDRYVWLHLAMAVALSAPPGALPEDSGSGRSADGIASVKVG